MPFLPSLPRRFRKNRRTQKNSTPHITIIIRMKIATTPHFGILVNLLVSSNALFMVLSTFVITETFGFAVVVDAAVVPASPAVSSAAEEQQQIASKQKGTSAREIK